jgi:hypothetical protein
MRSRRLTLNAGITLALCGALGCGDGSEDPTVHRIVPGASIGPINLGDSWAEVQETLGATPDPIPFGNLFQASFRDAGIEVVLAGAPYGMAGPDAKVIALGAFASDGVEFEGPGQPGVSRDDILMANGDPDEAMDAVDFYVDGWSAVYTADGSVRTIAVIPSYELAPVPPEMLPIQEVQ